ncbi:OmpA family protein [Patulibacter americanus]|uniref:OmpA family protein n=1 Tax=Patulibacter americanus TaxID=588672 RepID=UPI0003B7370B|nr:OmpA family protein [Patulibacter americanus]
MSRPQTPRRLARLASAALTGVLAATCVVPGAASAAAPPAIDGWTRGASNGALAFSVTADGGAASTIWPDGTRKTAMTRNGTPVRGGVSAWSADGNRVLLTALGGKSFDDVNPWTGQLVETMTDPMLDPNRYIQGPSISPDGLNYAWGTTGDGYHVGNPYDGVQVKSTFQSAGTAWSKADRLAWINDDRDPGETNDDPGVYVVNGASNTPPDSAHLAFLSDEDNGEFPMQLSMSADGTKLAYTTYDGPNASFDVRVSSAENGSEQRSLETGGAPGSDERYASISPDGTKVAFASNRSGDWAIYTANWDGTGVAIVPNTTLPDGEDFIGVAWQPSQVPDLNETHIASATETGSTLKLDLIAEQGTAPLVRTYQWQRCDDGTPASCVNTGVTTEGFPLDDAHVGHRYRVVRTVQNPAGTDTLASEITNAVVASTPADTDPPGSPTFDDTPTNPSNATSFPFAWTGAEAGGTYRCSLNNAAFAPCVSGQSVAIPGEGLHSFRVLQVDQASNAGVPEEFAWTVDTTKPGKPTIGTKPAAVTKETTAKIAFTGDEPNGSFECRKGDDDASWETCVSPADLEGLTPGDQRYSVRQLDEAGNASDPEVLTWKVDTTLPAKPTITTDLSGTFATSTPEIAFTGENGGTFACSVDDGDFAPCTSPAKPTGMTTGAHWFAVRQIDEAGNVGPTESKQFSVDVTGPAKPTLTGKPDAFVKVPKAVFTWTGADPDGTGFECSIDGIPGWDACESGDDVDGLPEGTYTFRVRQLDAHGNRGEDAAHTWTYDATNPAKPTLLSDLDDVRTTQATVRFQGERPEGEGTFECRLDQAAWQECSSPATVKGYAAGPHTFAVREIDSAGNPGEPVEDAFTVSFAGPAAPTVTKRPDARTEDTTATFDLTVADPHATVEYALDGGAWAKTKLPLTLTDLSVGDHVLLVRQTDGAGHHGKATTIAWTVVAPARVPTPEPAPAPEPTPAPAQAPAPAEAAARAAPKPAATTPAKAAAPAAQPKLTAVIGEPTGRPSGAGGTSSAATIKVKENGVGVGCAITGTDLTSCKVDLYVNAAATRTAHASGDRRVLVGTGEYRAKSGSRRMEVEVTLNATGRELLRTSPRGLKVSVAITGRPVKGEPLKATGVATLVRQRTTATVGGFAVDSATLTRAAVRQLTALAGQVRGTAVNLRVVGHTDGSTTDADYLKALGQRRAQAVAAFLRAHGVQAKATLVSRGATQPRASNATKGGRALNRRVELRIER